MRSLIVPFSCAALLALSVPNSAAASSPLPTRATGRSVVAAAVPGSSGAAGTRVVKRHFKGAIKHLKVAKHSHRGSYDRGKFGGWTDHGGGCDTRAVVLKQESLVRTTQNRYCTVKTGKWFSYYDGMTYTRASKLQIDHAVPVENAWISGAWKWSKDTRVRFYNDLGDFRSLVAVDSHDNESKGDQAPTDWMPAKGQCRYLKAWTAVKTRWHLTVTRSEKRALRRLGGDCSNSVIRVSLASIRSAAPPKPAALTCRARMSDATPAQYTYVRVIVNTGRAAAAVHAVAHYKTTTTAKNGRSGSNGVASMSFYTSGATPGFRVKVSVTVKKDGKTRSCATAFTPHR